MQNACEQVTEALDDLVGGLAPFVESELRAVYGDRWRGAVAGSFRHDRNFDPANNVAWDAHSLLTVMWDQWNSVFRKRLGHLERSMVSELREFRNRWTHQNDFDFDDAWRVLDSTARLLRAVSTTRCSRRVMSVCGASFPAR